MFGRILLGMANSQKMERIVRGSPLFTPLVRRFIAGETMEATLPTVRGLMDRGMRISLDFLGESVTQREEVAKVVDYYHTLIEFIHQERLKTGISLKLTQLGMDIDDQLAYENMRSILSAAAPLGIFVRMDMESTAYTERTLCLHGRLLQDFTNTGVVLQSYLHRTRDDLEKLIESKSFVRLVKGAYAEPSHLAYPDKADVNRQFTLLADAMMERGNYPAIATHDPNMIQAAKASASKYGRKGEEFEFQMLLGIRRDLQDSLVKEGYRMRVYTPFGTHWYPYMMRRLAERPANLWFMLKNSLRK